VRCDRGEGSDRGVTRGDQAEQQPQRPPPWPITVTLAAAKLIFR
jgi:hypothetical protein